MSTDKLNVVIVDDEVDYRDALAKKLRNSLIGCTAIAPPQIPIPKGIVNMRPDAVLVDYQLTQKPKDSSEPAVAYLGSLLVAAIREQLPATPILLLTRSKLADQRGKSFLAGAADLDEAFDDLMYKEEVNADVPAVRTRIRSLVDGYRILGGKAMSWKKVVDALKTPGYAKDELRRFGAPNATLQTEGGFRPASVARWVRKTMLAFPGLLIDELEAATDIGITVQSFRKPQVSKWFNSAKYDGVFALESDRWWRGTLRVQADSLKSTTSDEESASSFASAWNAIHSKVQVVSSKCCVCDLPTTDAVCAILRKPVMLRCSLPFYPDSRPAGFDIARISFKAIQETELDDAMFASNVLPIVRKIEAES